VSKNQLITWAALSGFFVGLAWWLLCRTRWVQTREPVGYCYPLEGYECAFTEWEQVRR